MDNKQKRPYRRRCRGGLLNCKNYIGDYTDVDGVNCCKQCDDYVDQNPYDPYWEQMEESFSLSKEYEELEKSNLLEDSYAYEKAFEYFQETYESWYDMRRRMSKERAEKERAEKERLCKERASKS